MNLKIGGSFLLASVVWGAVGLGYYVYGKKGGKFVPMIGGLMMIAASYFADTALVMSLIAVAIMAGIWFLSRQGY